METGFNGCLELPERPRSGAKVRFNGCPESALSPLDERSWRRTASSSSVGRRNAEGCARATTGQQESEQRFAIENENELLIGAEGGDSNPTPDGALEIH
jgi:hypothetical protein